MTTPTARPPMSAFTTPEIRASVRTVLAATAYLELIREKVAPVQLATVTAANLKMDLTDGSPILSMKDSYLSTDEAACAAMYADYGRRLIEGGCYGLTEADIRDGKCPDLVAESLKIDAENLLLKTVCPLFNVEPYRMGMKDRREFLDLTIRFVVGLPGFDKSPPKF